MVYAQVLKTCESNLMRVRSPPSAPTYEQYYQHHSFTSGSSPYNLGSGQTILNYPQSITKSLPIIKYNERNTYAKF
ncbi:MAG: hypothetical protein UX38_C0008G0011 [Microgenomates group bacterium GW2011_GWC1_46_16]|nr:MAG: hypothetical protein UX32_C0007G0051 [Microgenomates group bacterium GW2011_GWF1_46_12]KKU26178.1 MAG: hypothetical protein UX38_C0008G0011 [Microgenomates group bacterium GW2011_GWC1_46_16]KKU28172.1 MAG: hypothetical protein UX40_C0002G0012 [Microgenomates group bacterium GW2011_GWF2_46_18]KKU43743.1 MAG: hypothetical protein UX59_C0010G0010 [Microgenomates group bacterium GW2011_GWA1_46_7]KKU45611.1 MAG: hypothetical protein UX63_C0003G0037 [Microgenomates group bacterium GW2011_GWB1